jgi:xanthine dehydrogenase accessory factor
MSQFVQETVFEWIREGRGVVIATVAETKRSAPQPVGTKMAIDDRGHVIGAVSGGCVEGAVVEVAEGVLDGARPQLLRYGIADEEAWDVGLPCGGEIAVWVQKFVPDGPLAKLFEIGKANGRAVLVTVVDPPGPVSQSSQELGGKLLVEEDGVAHGSLGSQDLDETAVQLARAALWSEASELIELPELDAQLLIEAVAPPPRLIIVGAVDFAAQLATAAKLAGWRAFVIDPRARFATAERFPDAERVIAAWPQEAFAQLDPIDPATAIAVLTHDPKLDDAALVAALTSSAGYIGAMGSRRAQERRRDRLAEAGVDPRALERISAPIGLDLGALSAGETALSIMGEILALKHGRSGGRLIDAKGRIHQVRDSREPSGV